MGIFIFLAIGCNKRDVLDQRINSDESLLEIKSLITAPMPVDSLGLDSLKTADFAR